MELVILNTALSPVFARVPSHHVEGIPIFSTRDAYVANYERIASDHVKAIDAGNENPFMDVEMWRLSEESTRRVLVQHVPAGSRVLDVGVGLGRVMGPLVQYDRFGIDISLDYLKRARDRGLQVAFSRIEDMPYTDGCFDAAIVCDVLEHVLDLNACVQQILRVIKPGGVLLVRVPYKEDLSGYLDPSMPYEFVHLRSFDEQSLRMFFEKIMRCRIDYMESVVPYPSRDRLLLRLPTRGGPLQLLAQRFAPKPWRWEARLPRQVQAFVRYVHAAVHGWMARMHPLAPLVQLGALDDERILEWIQSLRTDHRDWYELLIPHLTQAVEINVVVRKPIEEETSAMRSLGSVH
jgi:SAM-dependent methyltransferase